LPGGTWAGEREAGSVKGEAGQGEREAGQGEKEEIHIMKASFCAELA